jgi:hypothetical protein
MFPILHIRHDIGRTVTGTPKPLFAKSARTDVESSRGKAGFAVYG